MGQKRLAPEDIEEDCGFQFRRVAKKSVTSTAAVKEEHVERNNVSVKQAALQSSSSNKQASSKTTRRRSSFVAIAAKSGRPRNSSLSASLSSKMPPAGVAPHEFYKHLLPDLPGPIKMRQLLVWVVQRMTTQYTNIPEMNSLIESVIDGLLNNKINTSWYQRPSMMEEEINKQGPKNQELLDCIQLYQKYNQKLRNELEEWNEVANRMKGPFIPKKEILATIQQDPSACDASIQNDIIKGAEWFTGFGRTVDQLSWTLSVANSFENHARSFCESVFSQIASRMFGSAAVRPEPLRLLRALSAANSTASC